MTKTFMTCGCLCVLALLLLSCSELQEAVESPSFRVEARRPWGGDYLHVEVSQRVHNGASYRLLGVAKDQGVHLRLLDDSTLVVTDIRGRGDGSPAVIANLKFDSLACLVFNLDGTTLAKDTSGLSSVGLAGYRIQTASMRSRDDVSIVRVKGSGIGREFAQAIVLLGAESVAIDSIVEDALLFTCVWQCSGQEQTFRVNIADLYFGPDDFTIVPR